MIFCSLQNASHCNGSRNTSAYSEATVPKSPCQFFQPAIQLWLIHHSNSWGQSAGAISVSLQMLAYGGNSSDLFRGAFMQSGSPIPVGNLTGGQVGVFRPVNLRNVSEVH